MRVALGAAPSTVAATTVLREACLVTLAGVAIGLPIAFVAARGLRTLMFGISAGDPLTFTATAVLFMAMGLPAGLIPAWRAARVDPMLALRAE